MDILPAQLGGRNAVDADAAAVQLEKAHEQIDHGGLARAGRADDGDLLAGPDVGGEVLYDDFIRRVGIAEPDVLELDGALHIRERFLLSAFVGKLLTFEEVEDAVRRGGGRLQIRHALRDLRQG